MCRIRVSNINSSIQSKAGNVKAIFFDIDGTLFSNTTYKISLTALEALRRVRLEGAKIFVATGRHRTQLGDIAELAGIAFDGYITLNGQYCYVGDSVVYKCPINPADVKRMVEYTQSTSAPCLFLEADSIYVNIVDSSVIREHEAVKSAIPQVRDISQALENDILQMGLYLQGGNIPEILDSLLDCRYTRWGNNGVDIVPIGGSKWIGIERILEHFGISPEQTISFGDSENDIEMLTHSGISVAMGNATDNLKAVADVITDDVDNDGIYNAMREIFGWD